LLIVVFLSLFLLASASDNDNGFSNILPKIPIIVTIFLYILIMRKRKQKQTKPPETKQHKEEQVFDHTKREYTKQYKPIEPK